MESTSDIPEAITSDFEPKHSQLPSVELPLQERKQWSSLGVDVGKDEAAVSKLSNSRIPRPVTRSREAETEVRDIGSAPGLPFPRSPTHVREADQLGNPDNQREATSLSEDFRQPRYGFNVFNSYEEMLANMEDNDPFTGEPPPPKEEGSHRHRSSRRSKTTDIPMDSIPGQTSPSSHHHSHHHHYSEADDPTRRMKKRKKSKTKKADSPETADLRSTYTVPVIDDVSGSKRRPSEASTGTFTVGRTDSRTHLISPMASRDPVSMETMTKEPRGANATINSQAVKKVRVDARESTMHSHSLPKTMDEYSSAISSRPIVRPHLGEHALSYGMTREESMYLDPKSGYQSTSHLEAIRSYVNENFRNRQCNTYILNADNDESRCQCGRVPEWHREERIEVNKGTKGKWSPEKHTTPIDATSFGVISFNGFGQEASKSAPYMRVDSPYDERDLETCWTLLSDYWRMPPPKLIISVTGGAKRFFMKARLKSRFKRGLVNAATTTGAWIVTGGTATGVMEFVGEAVRDHIMTTGGSGQKIVALGIVTWGIVDNKDSLIADDRNGLFPAHYNIDDLSPSSVRGVAPLDHNHTHFLLVDNGTDRQFGKEIKFRTALEQYISEKMETGVAKNQSVHVPVVILVLEGGENTIQTAVEGIKRNTPVVVVQGSGRAADFIALGYRETRNKDGSENSVFSKSFDGDFKARAESMLDWSREKNMETKTEKICKCVNNLRELLGKNHRQLVTVFTLEDLDTTNEIDQAILYALLKANKANAQSQLNLALAWNRCDVARQEIFNIENRTQWQHMDLYEAMFTALVQDRVDFVQLFMDNGVDLKKFLTFRRLRDLYLDVVNDRYSGNSAGLLRHLLQQIQNWSGGYLNCFNSDGSGENDSKLLCIVGYVVNYLLGDQHHDLYQDEKFIVLDSRDTKSQQPQSHGYYGDNRTPRYNQGGKKRQKIPVDFENPERELLLWAVLLNRKGLADLFWKSGKDHIGGALTASALLKALSKEADKEEEIDLSQVLNKHAAAFEDLAVGVLNECYQREKFMAHKLLVRDLTTWGGTTALTIADKAEQMDFMGHSACQTKLNKIWKGKMALYTSTWKILSALFLPFMIPLIKFSAKELHYQQETEPLEPMSTNQISPHISSDGDGGRDPYDDGAEFVPASKETKKKKTLYEVEMFTCCKDTNSINFWNAVFYYHTAPVVKFCYHTISQVVFLALFSLFVLTDLRPASEANSPGIVEIIVWAWAATLLLEEIRQIITKESNSLKYKVSGYFGSLWNVFDQFIYLMFIISIVLRYTTDGSTFVWARMFYCLTLSMYYLRFMQVFFVAKNIGPKVIMIRRMLTDLMFFLCIFIIFILAYGVASQALRYPNSDTDWILLKDVVYLPYWQMYGELFLEELEGDVPDCSSNDTELELNPHLERCPEESWLVIVLFALYMILTNVLLLNLLIAMFSYTFERVQENSEKVWRFYRYGLIHEYFDRPTLAPPLIIISHIWRVSKYIYRRCNHIEKISHDFRHVFQKEDNNKLTAFERQAMENHLFQVHVSSREHIDVKVATAGERIEKVIEDLEQIKEQVRFDSPAEETAEETNVLTLKYPTGASPRYDSREDIVNMQHRISGLEEQLLIQRGQLAVQQQLLHESIQLLRNMGAHSGATGRRIAFHPEPQIEIQDFREGSSQI